MALKKCCQFLPRMELVKYTIHRMEIRYSAKFISTMPSPPAPGHSALFYRRYTPSPAGIGARRIISSPLYPLTRQHRGKTHHFIAVIPPHPPAPGQGASFHHRHTLSPAGAGARRIILSPLYPRTCRHRGTAHRLIAAIPLTPPASGQNPPFHCCPLLVSQCRSIAH